MEDIPDYESSSEDEDDSYFNTAVAMEGIDLEATPLPNMIWTPTKYQWKKYGGTVLPGYKPAFEVKRKGNNVKLTEENSQYLDAFIEKHSTCIVKNATESLCETLQGLTINESIVYIVALLSHY
ncbi:hypothetical protein [Parasitella parasitica]|uniref:Uncharacterized protein n=1 Tax=Parasitella parasitica TaxID=35722 RepID=A0A0B7NJ24_9FUNG|nr:hypothetical protein [Parasitella parasitica]